VAAGSSVEWRIAPPSKEQALNIALPPLAIVENRDDSGKTWRLSGKIAGTPIVVRQDFKLVLERQGWRLDKVIPLGRDRQRSDLCLWKNGRQSIMLMLWEVSAGKTGFSLGLD